MLRQRRVSIAGRRTRRPAKRRIERCGPCRTPARNTIAHDHINFAWPSCAERMWAYRLADSRRNGRKWPATGVLSRFDRRNSNLTLDVLSALYGPDERVRRAGDARARAEGPPRKENRMWPA